MAWYKIEIRHGRGHQSHTLEYEWFDDDWTPTDIKMSINDSYYHLMDPIYHILKVNKLPENVKQRKIESCKSQLEHYKERLKSLEQIPTCKAQDWKYAKKREKRRREARRKRKTKTR